METGTSVDMLVNAPDTCMGRRSLWKKIGVMLSIIANPWMVVADKLRIVRKPLYKTKTGVRFFARGGTTDINDAVVVLSGGEYPPALVDLRSNAAAVVLDCGGHIGTFSMYAHALNSSAKVYVMEPVQENLELLRENLNLNAIKTVEVIPKALYKESGTFYIDLQGKPLDAGELVTERPSHSAFVTIEALSPADVWNMYALSVVDLMKVDIEGSEYAVLPAYAEFLASRVKRLIMEYHPLHGDDGRTVLMNAMCAPHRFRLMYETKNVLGFESIELSSRVAKENMGVI